MNLDKYDYLEVSETVIYAFRDDRYVILGEYESEDDAKVAFLKILDALNEDMLLM